VKKIKKLNVVETVALVEKDANVKKENALKNLAAEVVALVDQIALAIAQKENALPLAEVANVE
jgi:hypothetical protein